MGSANEGFEQEDFQIEPSIKIEHRHFVCVSRLSSIAIDAIDDTENPFLGNSVKSTL